MTSKVVFHINYRTTWGQELRVAYTTTMIKTLQYTILQTLDGENWVGSIETKEGQNISYSYELLDGRTIIEEGLHKRIVKLDKHTTYNVYDQWRAKNNVRNIFYSTAFKDVMLKRSSKNTNKEDGNGTWILSSPDVSPDQKIGLVGNIPALGSWQVPLVLSEEDYPDWRININIPIGLGTIEYKYVLLDSKTKEIISWEVGQNRKLSLPIQFDSFTIHDDGFNYPSPWWRGAGMAIPVFSLRSKDGLGIGEFNDLKYTCDLTAAMGMNMIQVLPINDTIATKQWTDSYPYAAISVYALHPLYIHIPSITKIEKETWYKDYKADQEVLNALPQIDFEAVLSTKTKYLNLIFKKLASNFEKEKSTGAFIKQNEWVKSYAVFCYLRDKYNTPDFSFWGEHAEYSDKIIKQFWDKNLCLHQEVMYFVFIQYHLDKQLKEIRSYANKKRIALKGDLPIGIFRHSCDAWTYPHLFHMDQQAGAPPDDYAVNGQNWGFPTYDWETMSKDGFAWWKSRMRQLAVYFDALRIDHILGFFRIWSIPMSQVSGTLGLFYPRLPVHLNELAAYGVKGDLRRFTMPYIRTYMLQQLFDGHSHEVVDAFLVEVFTDAFVFKPEFDTQQKIVEALESEAYKNLQVWSPKILSLLTEVLLIEEPNSNGFYFNPRITLHTTYAYRDLDDYTKRAFDRLYNDYFYQRHNEFWKEQAVWKLPNLVSATNMFICGEDLGMIPATVPGVMADLNVIPLEIQRMPKGATLFGMCSEYDYHTVCSPSCHDMSTVRGWWEGNPQTANTFYQLYMKGTGTTPRECNTEIVKYVVHDHLKSPSMLAIFPIQDLLGMVEELRLANPFAEQINEPSNPKHYWRYRLHLNIDELASNKNFIKTVKELLAWSGRSLNEQ